MKHPLQSLIDAPLANATKINLPSGRRSAPRCKILSDDIGCPKVSAKELRERKQKAEAGKLEQLYAYYAGTALSIERIAEHMGIYRQEQTGTDDKGKPIFVRKLDLAEIEANIAWRRKKADAA